MVSSHKINDNSSILGAFLQQGGNSDLVTGNTAGNVQIWDVRSFTEPTQKFNNVTGSDEMSGFSVHDNASLFAW